MFLIVVRKLNPKADVWTTGGKDPWNPFKDIGNFGGSKDQKDDMKLILHFSLVILLGGLLGCHFVVGSYVLFHGDAFWGYVLLTSEICGRTKFLQEWSDGLDLDMHTDASHWSPLLFLLFLSRNGP